MNVLIVHPCKGFHGGAEEVVLQLADYLLRSNNSVQIVTKNAPAKWLHIHHVRPCTTWAHMWQAVQRQLKWADVVNIHNAPATLTTLPRKVPVVWYCHEPMELFTSAIRKPIEALNRWWVRHSEMLPVVADSFNRTRFEQIYKRRPLIVPYGVAYDFWSTREQPSGIGGHALKILHVGTISRYKNQGASLAALVELVSAGIDASLTWVGTISDPQYFETLWAVIRQLPQETQQRIYRFDHRSQEEVRALYHQHDVLYHPIEGQGGWLVPFEAMCAGLPVITGPRFPAADLIQRFDLGIVEENPVAVMAERLFEAVKTKEVRTWVRDNLTWEVFGDRMTQIFEEAAR